MAKLDLMSKAVSLRKKGLSYSEILKQVPVAKSTLSEWFRDVGLSEPQKQRLTQKKLAAALRGALKRKNDRIQRCKKIREESIVEVRGLDRNAYWLVGAALYWAEGSKEKEHKISSPVIFSNSDGEMISFFYNWLIKICNVSPSEIYFELYIHENAQINLAKKYWAEVLSRDEKEFERVRLKKNKGTSFRKNRGKNYHGVLRVVVRKSSILNRKIMGWMVGMCQQFTNYSGVVQWQDSGL